MISYRVGTFETNSSSTHSMVICTDDEYKRWCDGELFCCRWSGKFKTKEEIIQELKKDCPEYFDESGNFKEDNDDGISFEELLSENSEYYDRDEWAGDLEEESDTYTTPSGDVIHVVCRYGYDY